MMWRRQLAQGAGMRSRKPSTAATHCCAVSHASSRPSPWVFQHKGCAGWRLFSRQQCAMHHRLSR